jgi:hypothetical protein
VTSGKATLEKFPHVQAWSGRLRERDSWRKIAGRA